ncbi:putative zinc finger protein [Ixodes scapularis]
MQTDGDDAADADPSPDDALGSAGNLLTEFTSHVWLGQWQCARACALTVLRAPFSTSEDRLFVRDYVRSVAARPGQFSTSANPLLLSPNHLSWLACSFLEDNYPEEAIAELKHDAEFRVLLSTFAADLPDACREELYLAYSRGASPLGEDLSPDCITALEEVLLSRPRETALLLGHAAGRLGGECAVARQLWLLHLRALRLCLGELKGSLSRYEEVGQRARTRLFMLLHLVPDPLVALTLQDPQWTKGALEAVFGDLLDLMDGGVLGEREVWESLVCRESALLPRAFADCENERHGRLRSDAGGHTLAVCEDTGRLDVREAFLKSLVSGEHFVDSVLNASMGKLHSGQWEKASRLFSHPALRDLYVHALLRAWNEAVSDDDACHVMRAIAGTETLECPMPGAELLLRRMRYHLVVTDWIVSSQRKRKTSLVSEADEKSRRRTVFGMLQHQTVLRVLHKTLGLGGLDAAATFRLLGLPGGEPGEAAEESSLQATQGRDCTLYRGYLTMQHVMAAFNNAILLGRLGANAPPPECPDDWDVQDGEAAWDTDTMASAISLYGLARVYKHAVLGQLQRFEEEAGRVFPLTFRLELLENAFSLLFVTHNNLRRDARDDEDATDAEDDARSEDPHSPTGSNNRVHQEGNQTAGGEDACHVTSPTLASSVAGAKETSDSLSGKGSTASSGAGPSAMGFLCPPFLVPDVLATLCSAVLAAWAASTKEAPTMPTWPVQTSVSWDEFAFRLDQLRKHIVDAQWRYELITSTSTLDAGPQDESMGPPPGSSSWTGNSESSRDELPVAPLRKLSRKSKRRRRCSSMTLDSSQRSIIEKMLAGPEALLRYCLWHSNYRSAGQVVQMMKLQGSHDDQELHFSQRLEDVTQRLAALSVPARATTQATDEKTADGLTTLVSQAAGEGLHLTMATALVDRLLCSSGVPGTPEAEHLLRHSPEGGSGMVGTLAERNFAEEYGSGGPHVAAIADLALTVGVPRDVSERLLALAVSKRESYATGNLCGQVRKLTTTLEALRQFVQEAIDGGGVGAVGSCGGDAEASLMALLGNYADVLDAETLQQQRAAWRTIEAVYRKVRVLLECQSSSSSGSSDSRVELHASFLALAKATSGDQRGNLRFLPAFKFDFLRAVYAHTRQLHGAIREASQHSRTKVGRHLEESHLWVLSQSPSALLTRLVLQEEVAPRRLEGVALQMKLSLGHVLARHCCPRILLAPPTSPTPALPRVLNDYAGVPTTAAARHPNFVVKCLLKGLISLLRVHCKAGDSFVTLGGAGALGRSSAFAAWSLGCQELRQVDLCQLQEGAGRLAFFLNLANLLTVHGAVMQAAAISPQQGSGRSRGGKHLLFPHGARREKSSVPIVRAAQRGMQ